MCPPVQWLPHSRMEILNKTYVLYTCDDGYRFPDGQKQELLDCRDTSVNVGRGMLQCLGLFKNCFYVCVPWHESDLDTYCNTTQSDNFLISVELNTGHLE